MHPKIMKRRGLVISEQLAEIDRDIKAVANSIARRVRLAGVLCIGEQEADTLEDQFHESVEAVLDIPSISEAGRRGRRELIAKLVELEAYLDSLFSASWVTSELIARCRQNLDRCRSRLDRIKAAE